MKKYYGGIDAHVKFCQFSILDETGKELLNHEVKTSAWDLIRFVKKLPKPLHLVIESSTLTEWLVRTLEHHVEKVEACDPRQNKWISSSDKSSDKIDAFKLAKLLRAGMYNPVHVPTAERQLFKEMVLDYHKLTGETTRFKNRIKGKFRSRGVYIKGQSLYSKRGREHYLKKLDSSARIRSILIYYDTLDLFENQKALLLQRLRSISAKYPDIANFMTMPGVGFIVAMTFFAVVDTPWRFEKKENLWSYCRLGVNNKTSAVKKKGGGQKGGSRMLKSMLMKASSSALYSCKKENEFSRHRDEMLERGKDKYVAQRSAARKICSCLYGMFKNGQPYRGDVAS